MPSRIAQIRMNRQRATGIGPSTQAQNKMLGTTPTGPMGSNGMPPSGGMNSGLPIGAGNGGTTSPMGGMGMGNNNIGLPPGLGPSPNVEQSLLGRPPMPPPNNGMIGGPPIGANAGSMNPSNGGMSPMPPNNMGGPSPTAMNNILGAPPQGGMGMNPDEQKKRQMMVNGGGGGGMM